MLIKKAISQIGPGEKTRLMATLAMGLMIGYVLHALTSEVPDNSLLCTSATTTTGMRQHAHDLPTVTDTSPQQVITSKSTSTNHASNELLTVADIKRTMRLPCNYVHDGYYIMEANECVNQVYQTLLELNDDDVPLLVEVGGHDGITKSISLKASICFNMNTLLIEGFPPNYNVLKQTRRYDRTVNAALCDQEFVYMQGNPYNSGQNLVKKDADPDNQDLVKIPCTTLDAELDKIANLLPAGQQDKLKLIFLVLDVEGHEAVALQGLQKYTPMKVSMENKMANPEVKAKVLEWAESKKLTGRPCGAGNADRCYNFHPLFLTQGFSNIPWMKEVFYGARKEVPVHHWATSEVSKSYYYYGQ